MLNYQKVLFCHVRSLVSLPEGLSDAWILATDPPKSIRGLGKSVEQSPKTAWWSMKRISSNYCNYIVGGCGPCHHYPPLNFATGMRQFHRNHPMSIMENPMTSVFPWENRWIPVTFPRRVHSTFDHRSSKRGRPRAAFNGHSAAGRRQRRIWCREDARPRGAAVPNDGISKSTNWIGSSILESWHQLWPFFSFFPYPKSNSRSSGPELVISSFNPLV